MDFMQTLILQSDKQNQNIFEIVPTFIHIFDFVSNLYTKKIFNTFPKQISNCYSSTDNNRFCSLFIGFEPYTLINKSGARINALSDEDQEHEFISDPELKYLLKQPKGFKPILLSITEKIDDIFNKICKKINEVVGSHLGLRFFLRRTLGGCEFGLCFDFQIENLNENLIKDYNCLVDKDPLLIFKISVKSVVPLLAGILIIGLVYLAKLTASIVQLISRFDIQLFGKIIKKTVEVVVEQISSQFIHDKIEAFCSKLCEYLSSIIVNQISIIQEFNKDLAFIFNLLLKIAAGNDFNKSTEMINKIFENCHWIKVNLKLNQQIIPTKYMFRIGLLIMLAFGSFMMNFQYRRRALKYKTENVAADYDKKQNTDEAVVKNEKFVELGN